MLDIIKLPFVQSFEWNETRKRVCSNVVESFDRIPFSMPSCEGISLDKIVDVQKFRPFVVKGVTKPPFVFPKFNYREWQRMMMRLKDHVSSHTQFEVSNFEFEASSHLSLCF